MSLTEQEEREIGISPTWDLVDTLRARVAELEKAGAEAMEWNWLDDNADETIPTWIAETLKPKPTA